MSIIVKKIVGKIMPSSVADQVLSKLEMVKAVLKGEDENSESQRIALIIFAIRIASAAIAFFSQVLLARWLGGFEYGVYAAVWVMLAFVGTIVSLGLPSAIIRMISEYREKGETDFVRGSIQFCMVVAFLSSIVFGVVGCYVLYQFPHILTDYYVMPVFLAAFCLPLYAIESIVDGISRCFDWPKLNFLPTYIIKPMLILFLAGSAYLLGFEASAVTAMWATFLACLLTTGFQFVLLLKKLPSVVPKGKAQFKPKTWILLALPIFLVDGFYVLQTSVDVMFISYYLRPEETGIYYASTKILALAHFVYFAMKASVAHRYAALYHAGNHSKFQAFVSQSVKWTFWPTLLIAFTMAVLGKYILYLFGSGFTSGAFLIWILSFGIVVRASVGPAEALLTMTDNQNYCAKIYIGSLLVNVVLNITLIPMIGLAGAAIATTVALAVESFALQMTAKKKLGIHAFIIPQNKVINRAAA